MDPFADESFLAANNRPSNGWARLGQALAGNHDYAGQKGFQAGVGMQAAILAAHKARDAEVGRQAMAKAAADAGDNELANAFLQGAGDNLAQIGSYRLDKQKQAEIDAANAIAADPNGSLDSLNRRMIVIGNKPVDLTKIVDHTVFNPMLSPGSQTLSTNELGQALTGAANALANQRNASAGTANARTAKIRSGSEDGGDYSGEKPTSLTGEQVKAMFGSEDGGVDTASYRRFLDFQRARGIPNAQRAAQLFSTDMSNVEGGADVPEAPEAPAPGLADRFMSALGMGGNSAPVDPSSVDPASQKTAADAVGPLTPEQARKLPPGTLFKTMDGRLLRRH